MKDRTHPTHMSYNLAPSIFFLYACQHMQSLLKKQIAIPQDHGSWVFILSPLLIGIFAGNIFTYATFNLIVAAMSAFMLRQPMTIFIKALSGRRSRADLASARFWLLIYGIIAALALIGLILEGFGYLLYLAIPAVPVFAWHLWLVSKHTERKQAGIEIIATGVLSLAAPAAYWIGIHRYDSAGWWLWFFAWMQSAASIVYAYLRLEQRGQAEGKSRSEQWQIGRRALYYTSFNLAVSLLLGWGKLVPQLIFIPFLAQWLEALWGITHPSIGWKPVRIGVRQFIVSTLLTTLFIVFWRIS